MGGGVGTPFLYPTRTAVWNAYLRTDRKQPLADTGVAHIMESIYDVSWLARQLAIDISR